MTLFGTYCKSSIKPPPGGGLFILSPFEDGGGLIEAGGYLRRGFIQFSKDDGISSPLKH